MCNFYFWMFLCVPFARGCIIWQIKYLIMSKISSEKVQFITFFSFSHEQIFSSFSRKVEPFLSLGLCEKKWKPFSKYLSILWKSVDSDDNSNNHFLDNQYWHAKSNLIIMIVRNKVVGIIEWFQVRRHGTQHNAW